MSRKDVDELHRRIDGSSNSTYITSRGIEIKLRPIPPYLIQMTSSSFEMPEPPTYTVQTEGGGIEVHKHDEASIAQSSPEEQATWIEYTEKVNAAASKASEQLMTIVLIDGVDVEIPDENRWLKKMSLMGITVPEDPEDRLLMYKKTELLGNPDDMAKIMELVLGLTGVNREDLNKIKNSFQDRMES
jgi:hypothetical protein